MKMSEFFIGVVVCIVLYFMGQILMPEPEPGHPIIPEPNNLLKEEE